MPKGVYKKTEEHKRNLSKSLTGKTKTEETKRRMRKSHIRVEFTEEHCKNISLGTTGKKKTKEHCKNISLGKQREQYKHKINCQCCICKAIRGEQHISDCQCCICRAKRGEYKGENNFSWQGGLSNFPYPFDFNNELKELIRKRDNYTCQLCNKTQEEEGKKLAVHHIDYVKENLDPNNLLTLCSSCNGRVNSNRKYWTGFFNNLIKSK